MVTPLPVMVLIVAPGSRNRLPVFFDRLHHTRNSQYSQEARGKTPPAGRPLLHLETSGRAGRFTATCHIGLAKYGKVGMFNSLHSLKKQLRNCHRVVLKFKYQD
jgi:hypothetical protein